jgi:hypothetical protein
MINGYKVLVGSLMRRDHSGGLGVEDDGGRMMLKCILWK